MNDQAIDHVEGEILADKAQELINDRGDDSGLQEMCKHENTHEEAGNNPEENITICDDCGSESD